MNSLIKNTLAPLGAPVAFLEYAGKAAVYITFFCYNEQGELFADDAEVATGFYVQVDLWSKVDYTALADQVKSAMESAGFTRTSGADLYESDTKIYHKAQRFYYYEEVN